MALSQKSVKTSILKPSDPKEVEKAAKDFVEKLSKKDTPRRAIQKSTSKKPEPTAPVKNIVGARKHNHYKQPVQENAIRQAVDRILPDGIPKRVEKEVREKITSEVRSMGYEVTSKYLSDVLSTIIKEQENG